MDPLNGGEADFIPVVGREKILCAWWGGSGTLFPPLRKPSQDFFFVGNPGDGELPLLRGMVLLSNLNTFLEGRTGFLLSPKIPPASAGGGRKG